MVSCDYAGSRTRQAEMLALEMISSWCKDSNWCVLNFYDHLRDHGWCWDRRQTEMIDQMPG